MKMEVVSVGKNYDKSFRSSSVMFEVSSGACPDPIHSNYPINDEKVKQRMELHLMINWRDSEYIRAVVTETAGRASRVRKLFMKVSGDAIRAYYQPAEA